MAFHPNAQLRLVEQEPDLHSMLEQSFLKAAPWDSIVDFATHESFCGQVLYPRQQTLLRLIYLETDQMSAYDLETIEEWRQSFQRHRDVAGVQPDIWERVEYLKVRGYRRFPHIQTVLGRRASKNFIGGILIAEQIGYLISLDNPQRHYGIREGKDSFCNIGSTSQTQAQRHQFADARDIIEHCAFLKPHIAESKDHQMRLRTPADLRRIAEMRSTNVPVEHTIASLWVVALSASSVAGRSATAYANILDEFAFHVEGSGSVKTSDEIYQAWAPALGQYKKEALTYVPSSPFNKIGKFYELYQQGKVLMGSYRDTAGLTEEARQELIAMRVRANKDIVELTADPTMLIFQGASWDLYRDWQRGPELVGVKFNDAPEDDLTSEEQQRRKLRNPDKFKVEREGQFADVAGAYLDAAKIEAMFHPVLWRDPPTLAPIPFGSFTHVYRIHADPSTVGANFALAVGHTEIAPCDRCGTAPVHKESYDCPCGEGTCWPHVIFDRLHVWRPRDFPINPESGRHEIDYTQVERELDQLLYTFPSTTKFSTDQFHSTGLLQRLRRKYSPGIRIVEDTATEAKNFERAERFKSAINLGWVHCFDDGFFDQGGSLLEQECKYLSLTASGKVVKQDFGPVVTKDLYDAVSTVATDLLHEALERWDSGHMMAHSYGSSHVAGLKSGREFDRLREATASNSVYSQGTTGTGKAWDDLRTLQTTRNRQRAYTPSRRSSIYTRDTPRRSLPGG